MPSNTAMKPVKSMSIQELKVERTKMYKRLAANQREYEVKKSKEIDLTKKYKVGMVLRCMKNRPRNGFHLHLVTKVQRDRLIVDTLYVGPDNRYQETERDYIMHYALDDLRSVSPKTLATLAKTFSKMTTKTIKHYFGKGS